LQILPLVATVIFIAAGIVAPAFSFGAASASSWSFYGNYDYSQDGDAADTGRPGHSRDAEVIKERDEDQSEKTRFAQQRERIERDVEPGSEQRFDSYDVNDPEYSEYLSKFTYVLYYGGFDSRVRDAILAVEPTLLVTNYDAVSPEMRNEFAKNNITVIAYLPIHWTDTPIDVTLEKARSLLEDGADGLFIDEAATVSTDWEFWYHGRIYETAKEFDKDAVVIINPGSASIAERAMQVADIICFEHEWRDIAQLNWASDYPGWRFMGISSNEFVKVMGYHVGDGSARDDLEEARSLNIAYHYSADHYIWLPPWLDVYGGVAAALHPVGDYVGLDLSPVARPPGEQEESARPEPPEEEETTPDDMPSEQEDNEVPAEPKTPAVEPEEPEGGEDSSGANKPPRARAGDDQYIEVAETPVTVHLDGSASSDADSKDRQLSFSWQQTDGPRIELDETDSAASFTIDPSMVAESDVRFDFELTVSDTDGADDADSISVTASGIEASPDKPKSRDNDNATGTEAEPVDGGKDEAVRSPRDLSDESNSTNTATEADVSSKEESRSSNSTTSSSEQ
jgi:hypothetical protein